MYFPLPFMSFLPSFFILLPAFSFSVSSCLISKNIMTHILWVDVCISQAMGKCSQGVIHVLVIIIVAEYACSGLQTLFYPALLGFHST